MMGIKNSKLFGGRGKVKDQSIYQHGYNPCYQVQPTSINQVPNLPPSKLPKPPEIVVFPPVDISESSEDSDIIMSRYERNPAYTSKIENDS